MKRYCSLCKFEHYFSDGTGTECFIALIDYLEEEIKKLKTDCAPFQAQIDQAKTYKIMTAQEYKDHLTALDEEERNENCR